MTVLIPRREIRQISRSRSHSPNHKELGHFTLLFCKRQIENVQRFIYNVLAQPFLTRYYAFLVTCLRGSCRPTSTTNQRQYADFVNLRHQWETFWVKFQRPFRKGESGYWESKRGYILFLIQTTIKNKRSRCWFTGPFVLSKKGNYFILLFGILRCSTDKARTWRTLL